MIWKRLVIKSTTPSSGENIECIAGVLPSVDDMGETSDIALAVRRGFSWLSSVKGLSKEDNYIPPDDLLIDLVSDYNNYPATGFGLTTKATPDSLRWLADSFSATSRLLSDLADELEAGDTQ